MMIGYDSYENWLMGTGRLMRVNWNLLKDAEPGEKVVLKIDPDDLTESEIAEIKPDTTEYIFIRDIPEIKEGSSNYEFPVIEMVGNINSNVSKFIPQMLRFVDFVFP